MTSRIGHRAQHGCDEGSGGLVWIGATVYSRRCTVAIWPSDFRPAEPRSRIELLQQLLMWAAPSERLRRGFSLVQAHAAGTSGSAYVLIGCFYSLNEERHKGTSDTYSVTHSLTLFACINETNVHFEVRSTCQCQIRCMSHRHGILFACTFSNYHLHISMCCRQWLYLLNTGSCLV